MRKKRPQEIGRKLPISCGTSLTLKILPADLQDFPGQRFYRDGGFESLHIPFKAFDILGIRLYSQGLDACKDTIGEIVF